MHHLTYTIQGHFLQQKNSKQCQKVIIYHHLCLCTGQLDKTDCNNIRVGHCWAMNLLGFCAKIKVENQMGFSAGGSFWAKTKVGFLSWKNSRCCCMMGTEQQRCQRERERGADSKQRPKATPVITARLRCSFLPG